MEFSRGDAPVLKDEGDDGCFARVGGYHDLIDGTLRALAVDASPAARLLGARIAWCLECPGDCTCEECPYLGVSRGPS